MFLANVHMLAIKLKVLSNIARSHNYLQKHGYSETCANNHLYPETTCLKKPLSNVPIAVISVLFKRPPLYRDHFLWAHMWSLNTGFIVAILVRIPGKF